MLTVGIAADFARFAVMIAQPIRLVAATTEQKQVIGNLIQLYLHDMTAVMPFPVGPDGRFQYDFLDRFWQHPYLVYAGDEIAGFCLVIRGCPLTGRDCWFMAEFFILRAYRGHGTGRAALAASLDAHAGDWTIAVPHANTPAEAFWSKVLAPLSPQVTDMAFEGDLWRLRAFVA